MVETAAIGSGFPQCTPALEYFGFKFTPGGAHISRTIMLAELRILLAAVPVGASASEYREAVENRNVLGKPTDSTRKKSFRHLRELYAMDETVPVFGLLRQLNALDPTSLPLLAFMVAWSCDTLLRATTEEVFAVREGELVETAALAGGIAAAFPRQYSSLNQNKIARNAASSWTQSGHLVGRSNKKRVRVKATPVAVTMALLFGEVSGFYGAAALGNPWCRLLDLNEQSARAKAMEAHRSGLLTMRAVGDVVELSFPRFAAFLKAKG